METIKQQLFSEVAESDAQSANKVTVVGVGQVGMACVFSILTQVRILTYSFIDAHAIVETFNLFVFFSHSLAYLEYFQRCGSGWRSCR